MMDLDDEEYKATRRLNGLDDKIEAGEYVRTKDGKIGIFDRYSSRKENSLYKSTFNCFIKIRNRKTPLQCCEDYIVKHSKQLIDLIEVGDFVNGFPILEPIYNGNTMYGIDEGYENFKKSYGEIKTILTRENYMDNCYKVGGRE